MSVTVTLTTEEVDALRLEFFPRMLTASVAASNIAAAHALYKICPTCLPWAVRREIEKSPGR